LRGATSVRVTQYFSLDVSFEKVSGNRSYVPRIR